MRIILDKIKNFLVYLFLFLLPWQTRLIWHSGELNGGYWEYGTISIYATEIILWLAVICSVIRFICSKNQESRIKNQETPKTLVLIFLLLASYVLILSLFALRPSLHFYYLFRFLEGAALFWLIRQVDLKKTSLVFIVGMIPQALLGVWQFLTQSSFASKWLGMALHDPGVLGTFVVETASGRWLRAYGGLPHPNILGGYLIVAILFLFWLYNEEHSINKQKFSIFNFQFSILVSLIVLFSIALFFTFSRSAWLALFIGLLVYWFESRNIYRSHCEERNDEAIFQDVEGLPRPIRARNDGSIIRSYSLFIILIFLALGTIFREPTLTRLQNQNRLEIKSQIERAGGYQEAWQIIRHHPVTGVGLGNYTYAVWKEIDSSRLSHAYQPVHNIFVLLLAEIGIIGILLLFIFLFIAILKNSLLLTSYFLILFLGFFDHYLLTLYPGLVLLFLSLRLCSGNKD